MDSKSKLMAQRSKFRGQRSYHKGISVGMMAPKCSSPALSAFTPLAGFQRVLEAGGKSLLRSLGSEFSPGFPAALPSLFAMSPHIRRYC